MKKANTQGLKKPAKTAKKKAKKTGLKKPEEQDLKQSGSEMNNKSRASGSGTTSPSQEGKKAGDAVDFAVPS